LIHFYKSLQNIMDIPDLTTAEGSAFLDTKGQKLVWGKLQGAPSYKYENLSRWHNNISSYGQEKKSFPLSEIKLKFSQTDKSELKAFKKKHEKKKAAESGASGNKKVSELKLPPDFIASRLAMWDRLKKEKDHWLSAQTPVDITDTAQWQDSTRLELENYTYYFYKKHFYKKVRLRKSEK